MAILVPSSYTAPRGSYVVAGPARTDALGDILRASFVPGKEAGDDFGRLLDRIDRSDQRR